MKRNIYALITGIDDYEPPLRKLRGCRSDAISVQEYLETFVDSEEFDVYARVLLDQQATYENIIDGFRSHLCRAGRDDVALFFFSGHGSREKCPEEFWHIEPDHMNETLVCYDSRMIGRDLADKELARLIAEAAENSPHIVIILDSCHAGSGTREMNTGAVDADDVRLADEARVSRSIENYIVSPDFFSDTPIDPGLSGRSRWIDVPCGTHVLLAACRDNQLAKEYSTAAGISGAFTHFLLDSLRAMGGKATYSELMKSVSALMRGSVCDQTPQLEVVDAGDIDRIFLGGAIQRRSSHFTVSYDKGLGWVVDAGAVHGIPAASAGTTQFALFRRAASASEMRLLSNSVARADVTEVRSHLSRVSLSANGDCDPRTQYRAALLTVPAERMGVMLNGDPGALQLVREAIRKSCLAAEPSLFINETSDGALIRLSAKDGSYELARIADDKRVATPVAGFNPTSASLAVERLEHIARWYAVNNLANPFSGIPADAIELRSFSSDIEVIGPEVRLEYRWSEGRWIPPRLTLCLSNKGDRKLYCAIFALSERFAIETPFFPAGGLWIEPGQDARSQQVYGRIPDELSREGVNEVWDVIKLLISTEEFDPRLLRQDQVDALQVRYTRTHHRFGSTLDRLMNRIATRELAPELGEGDALGDWRASSLVVTTILPSADFSADSRSA